MGAKLYESIAGVLAAIILLVGCQQPATLVPTPQPSECSPAEVEIIWPQLQAVQPDKTGPGGEVKLSPEAIGRLRALGYLDEIE